MQEIKLPTDKNFIADLILQRTGIFIKLGGGAVLNNWFSNGEKECLADFLFEKNLLNAFLKLTLESIKAETDALTSHIPTSFLKKIVSVGPGNGLCELFLVAQGHTSELLLIDIEQTEQHRHGFNTTGSGYANLAATKKFISHNISSKVEIHTCNPQKEPLPNFEYTLLLSLLSMGFHYPCDEYVDFIASQKQEGAMLIFDKRHGAPDQGFEKLLSISSLVSRLPSQKYDRVILKLEPNSQDQRRLPIPSSAGD